MIVLNRQVQAVTVGDALPVGHARAAQRVGAELEARVADRVHVHDAREIVHVLGDDNRAGARCALRRPAQRGQWCTSC